MVQGSVTLSYDLETLLWGQGPGTNSRNSEQQALSRKAVTWHSSLPKPSRSPSVKNESMTPAWGARRVLGGGGSCSPSTPILVLESRICPHYSGTNSPGVRGKFGGKFFQVTFQEHLLEECSVGHHLGSAHLYSQPLLSKRGMNWTGAPAGIFQQLSDTAPSPQTPRVHSEPHR